MSLIYDALRKSEEQRRAGEVPSLSTPTWQPRRRPPSRWPVVAGVAFVAIAVAVYFGFREDEPVADVATADGTESADLAGTGTTPAPVDVNRRPRREVQRPIEVPTSKVPVARPSDGAREIVAAARERRRGGAPDRRAASADVDLVSPDIQRRFDEGEVFANNADQLKPAPPTAGGNYVPPEAAMPAPLPDPEPTAPEPPRDPNRMTTSELAAQRRAARAAAAAEAQATPMQRIPGARPTRSLSDVQAAPTPRASVPMPSAPMPSAPIASAPVASAPVASAPVASAPVAGAPVASTPVTSAPVPGAVPPPSAPVASAPAPASANAPTTSAAAPSSSPVGATPIAPAGTQPGTAATQPQPAGSPGTPVSPNVAAAQAQQATAQAQPLAMTPNPMQAQGQPPLPAKPGPIPTPSTSTVPTPPPSAPGIDPSLPPVQLVYELPLAMRQSLPELKLNMHVYNADPARRFVIIDGTRAGEGQPLSQGLDVAEIRPDGIVLRYQSQTFLLPRGGR